MLKNKQELIFTATGIVLILILTVFIFYSVDFLFEKTTQTLDQNFSDNQKNTRFNLDGLKKLGIIQ